MSKLYHSLVGLLALTTIGLWPLASSPARAAPLCIADWSEAAAVVSREGLRSHQDVQGQTRNELGADVVRITLCREQGGTFVYRLTIRGPNGRVSNTTVSAQSTHR